LPDGFAPARARVRDLSAELRAIEGSADCIEPERLARRAQAVLDRQRWNGWRAVVRRDDGSPCGWIHLPGGDATTTLGGALDTDGRQLLVSTGAPRSVFAELYGQGSIGDRLFVASGARCFTIATLRSAARRAFAPKGREVRLRLTGPLTDGAEIMGPQGRRYEQGCAVAQSLVPDYRQDGEIDVVLEVLTKAGP
jgi:hypothetical protein